MAVLQVILLIGSFGCVYTAKEVCTQEAVADIVFLVDGSWSIGTDNFQQVKDFLHTLVNGFSVGPDQVHIGLAQYSNDPKTEFLLDTYEDKEEILDYIKALPYKGGGTMTGLGLDFILKEQFTEEAGSRARQGVPQIAVVITDGRSQDDVEPHADDLRRRGIILYAIGIKDADIDELREIGNEPHNQHVYNVSDFSALQGISQNIVKVLCTTVEETRRQITQASLELADIFFLVDSSTDYQHFKMIRSVLIYLANQLNVNIDYNRMGLAQFGGDVKVEFLLNGYNTKEEVLHHLKTFQLSPDAGGSRKIGAAMDYARTNFLTPEAGVRLYPGFRQYLVLMVSGGSDDSMYRQSQLLRDQGVNVITVGYGGADHMELQIMAYYSSMSMIMGENMAHTAHELKTIFESKDAHSVEDECDSATVADIVFILDQASSTVVDNLNIMRNFLYRTVAGFDISSNKVRVGVVLYSDTPKAEMYLDTYGNKQDILHHIRRFAFSGGAITNTGEALQFANDYVFSTKRGSRHRYGVEQFAVVLTAASSADDVSLAAMELRQSGVRVFTVGVENADVRELHRIASYPPQRFVFMAEDFAKLSTIHRNLRTTVCHEINRARKVIHRTRSNTATKIIHTARTFPIGRSGTSQSKTHFMEFDRTQTSIPTQGCQQTEEADVYFLIDESGSINNKEFLLMKKFILEFLLLLNIGPKQVRAGLVKFSSQPTREVNLVQSQDAASFEAAVERVYQDGGGTNVGKALYEMQALFQEAVASRPNPEIPRILILISDGKSEDQVELPAKMLREQGVVVYSIGVKGANQEELNVIAGDPDRTFMVNNFDALLQIRHDVVRKMCSKEVCSDMRADVLLLVESSSLISTSRFGKIKTFLGSLLDQSLIGPDALRLGLVQYGSKQEVEFHLNSQYRKDELLERIGTMRNLGGLTETGKALRYVSRFFDVSKGGRTGVPHILVLLSEGKSQDDVEEAANLLKQQGVIIYAIGIGSTNSQQMSRISGGMNNKYYFLKDFDGLPALSDTVMFDICNLEGCQIDMADIIFLVDGSQAVTSDQFHSVKHLMSGLVNISSVGGNHVQMGAILYAAEAQIQFALNRYTTRKELRQAISQLRPLGGDAYTGRALGYSLEYFSARHGSRKQDQVHKVLIVITSEETRDVGHLAEVSAKLRKNRVSVFGVGVKGGRNTQLPNQLLTMTNNPSRVFYADDYNGLESLDRKISQAICDANQAVCKMDLVILVDGSESIVSSNFLLMKNFMTDIVKSFNITPGFLQVGVGQFSTHQQKEFYLNEHTSSAAIIKAIHNIRQLREGTKIVPALKFIKDFFKTQHGSRRDAGVRQILLLITDGETDEDVEAAADDLRDSRVDVFVIGVGRVQTDQLLKIAGSKDRFLPINAYEELKSMLAVLVGTFCPESDDPDPVPPTPIPTPFTGCNVNIAIGFDYASRPTLTGSTEASLLHEQLLKIINKISTLDHICCMPNNTVKPKIFFSLANEERLVPYDGAAVVKKVSDGVLQRNTVFNTHFVQSFQAGLRHSAASVKVAIIISDGLDESVEKLEVESDRLRRSGVSALLMVAFEKSQDVHKLQMVEFGRSFGYQKPYFLSMHHLEEALKKDIEKATLRECCGVMCMCSGEEGMRGARGKPGTKGIQGPKGYAGYPGEEGIHGQRGVAGQTGPQGMQGCPGDRGSKGTHGYNGEAGELGDDGLNGVVGEQGDTGVDGAPGDRGEHGRPGRQGVRGEPGLKGRPGVKGATGGPGKDSLVAGQKGEPGSRGQQGEAGLNGESGTPGDPGHTGLPGKRGAHGTKGLPGAPGDGGSPGSAGFPGTPGSQGPIGQPGQIGLPGAPGQQGPRGIQGAKGSRGSPGHRGKKGHPGDLGLKGDIGSIGPRGPPGAVGEYGYGSPGPKGRKGETGFPGYHGFQGENGSKGRAGSPGDKGVCGRGGNPGNKGPPGEPGAPGHAGHRGPRGAPGPKLKSECELVNYVRDNCACSMGQEECPAYPTELVIALDMSQDVTPEAFQNMRVVAKNLLEDVAMAESNCPRGARVAVVSFSSSVKYLVRFSEFRQKKLLLTEVDNIALERTSNDRNTGAAMRYVARHVFKRTRKGLMMRKVAIFITNGASQDVKSINTGILELKANDIHTAVVGFRNVPNIISAIEADETRSFLVKLMRTDQDVRPQLSDVKRCLICYDPCKTESSCSNTNKTPAPVQVDLDLAVLMDGSHTVQAGQYAGAKELLGSLVEQIAVSSQPSRSGHQARVALYQTSSSFAPTGGGQVPVQQEFDFTRYQDSSAMKSHIFQSMQQLGGSSGLGYALEWVITRGLQSVAKPRQNKMVLVVVGGETSYWDRARLEYASRLARCQGVVVFTLTVGDHFNSTQVEELASLPLEQHLVHLGDVKQAEQDYAKRFMQIFLQFVKRQVNTYPASSEQWICREFQQQIDGGLTSVLEEGIPLPTAPSYNQPAAIPFPTAPRYNQPAAIPFPTAPRYNQPAAIPLPTAPRYNQPAAPPVPTAPTYNQPVATPAAPDQTGDSQIEIYYGTGQDGEYYSGRGDTSEFDVIQLTEDATTLQAVACTLKHDPGRCRDFVVKWRYDATQRRCYPFWYGGCGGNGNRFDSQEECQAHCVWTP